MNDELFYILDKNKKDINSRINYKVNRLESKKMKKAKQLKVLKKRVIALSLGSVVVFSGLNLIKITEVNEEIKPNIDFSQSQNIEISNDLETENIEVTSEFMQQTIEKNVENEKFLSVRNFENSNRVNNELQRNIPANFQVGSNEHINYIHDFMNSNEYRYFEKYAEMYAIDPSVMVAIAMQESTLNHNGCLPEGDYYNGCAIGIMQIEKPYGSEITAYNYETNQLETIICSEECVRNVETNIKAACMLFQNALDNYNGNVFLAIQSHNYGETMVNKALDMTASELGVDVETIKSNYDDITWQKYIKDIHENPHNYLNNWSYKTYGDGEYLNKILSYCVKDEVSYIHNHEVINMNLANGMLKNQNKRQV